MKLADFKGRWLLSRHITDHLAGETASLEGEAIFAPCPDGLMMTENGKLTIADRAPISATRSYEWRDGANGIDIYFDNGRFFHSIDTSPEPQAGHWCDPDQYDVTYDFSGWPEWTATWVVKGPRKDYRMVSTFTRP